MIKKFLLSVCLCCLCTVYVCAEALKKDVSAVQQIKEEKYILKQKAKDRKDCMYKLKKSGRFYINGYFGKAESYINEVLLIEPDNEKATELKNKILLLKEKGNLYKKTLVEDYYIELIRAIRDNNCYEGYLYVKKIKRLAPKENLASFNDKLMEEKQLILSAFEHKKDKKIFLNSIDTFLNEKYGKSAKLIYKLYEKYPKFEDFVGMSRYYAMQEKNNKRSKLLYNKALKYFRAGKLGQAKTYAEMAYSLRQENIKLKLLIEQIDMEGIL